jgi:hypothetical protein
LERIESNCTVGTGAGKNEGNNHYGYDADFFSSSLVCFKNFENTDVTPANPPLSSRAHVQQSVAKTNSDLLVVICYSSSTSTQIAPSCIGWILGCRGGQAEATVVNFRKVETGFVLLLHRVSKLVFQFVESSNVSI